MFPAEYLFPKVTLCVDCAQHVVRTMLEDIIEYRNGVRVSLADIMFYGRPEIDEMRAEAERQFKEKIGKLYEKSSEIFDFKNESDS